MNNDEDVSVVVRVATRKCSLRDLLNIVGLTDEDIRAKTDSEFIAMLEGAIKCSISNLSFQRSYGVSTLKKYLGIIRKNSIEIANCRNKALEGVIHYSSSLIRDGLKIYNKELVIKSFFTLDKFDRNVKFVFDNNGDVFIVNQKKQIPFNRKIIGTVPFDSACFRYLKNFFSDYKKIRDGVPIREITLIKEVIHGVVSKNNILLSLSADGRLFLEGNIDRFVNS